METAEVDKQDLLAKIAELRETSNEGDSAAHTMMEAVAARTNAAFEELRAIEAAPRASPLLERLQVSVCV